MHRTGQQTNTPIGIGNVCADSKCSLMALGDKCLEMFIYRIRACQYESVTPIFGHFENKKKFQRFECDIKFGDLTWRSSCSNFRDNSCPNESQMDQEVLKSEKFSPVLVLRTKKKKNKKKQNLKFGNKFKYSSSFAANSKQKYFNTFCIFASFWSIHWRMRNFNEQSFYLHSRQWSQKVTVKSKWIGAA